VKEFVQLLRFFSHAGLQYRDDAVGFVDSSSPSSRALCAPSAQSNVRFLHQPLVGGSLPVKCPACVDFAGHRLTERNVVAAASVALQFFAKN
jgi:hypothetical protein